MLARRSSPMMLHTVGRDSNRLSDKSLAVQLGFVAMRRSTAS